MYIDTWLIQYLSIVESAATERVYAISKTSFSVICFSTLSIYLLENDMKECENREKVMLSEKQEESHAHELYWKVSQKS